MLFGAGLLTRPEDVANIDQDSSSSAQQRCPESERVRNLSLSRPQETDRISDSVRGRCYSRLARMRGHAVKGWPRKGYSSVSSVIVFCLRNTPSRSDISLAKCFFRLPQTMSQISNTLGSVME